MLPRRSAACFALTSALLLAGCSGLAAPDPMAPEEIDALTAAYDAGDMSVGDAVGIAPEGTLGMIDVRTAAGVGDTQVVLQGTPPEDFHDWTVVGLCVYPESVPTVEVAAVPAGDAGEVGDGRAWNLECDGPPPAP